VRLSGVQQISYTSYDREFLGLRLRGAKSGWCLWNDLAEFCEKSGEPVEAFSVEMDFARLDEEAESAQ